MTRSLPYATRFKISARSLRASITAHDAIVANAHAVDVVFKFPGVFCPPRVCRSLTKFRHDSVTVTVSDSAPRYILNSSKNILVFGNSVLGSTKSVLTSTKSVLISSKSVLTSTRNVLI